jgi:hypothetical protein
MLSFIEMLKKQEEDRLMDIREREKRAQMFVGKNADVVLKTLDYRNKEEDDMIRKYELEREMKARLDDERRIQMTQSRQAEMQRFLAS